jgi:membrane protease YdiL (CAAX protease family)
MIRVCWSVISVRQTRIKTAFSSGFEAGQGIERQSFLQEPVMNCTGTTRNRHFMPYSRNPRTLLRPALFFQGGILVVALVAIAIFGVEVHIGGQSPLGALVMGSLAALGMFVLLYGLSRLPGFFPSTLKRHARDLHDFVSGFPTAGVVCLAVLAGVSEELFFRAFIQGGLANLTNDTTSVIAASIIFGLAHFLSLTYFLVATLMGALLGITYVLSESILLVMVWHSVYDLIALMVLIKRPHWLDIDKSHA